MNAAGTGHGAIRAAEGGDTVNFSVALVLLQDGGKVRRRVWDSMPHLDGARLELIQPSPLPDGREFMPQLIISYADGSIMRPFSGANWDLLAVDWYEVKP